MKKNGKVLKKPIAMLITLLMVISMVPSVMFVQAEVVLPEVTSIEIVKDNFGLGLKVTEDSSVSTIENAKSVTSYKLNGSERTVVSQQVGNPYDITTYMFNEAGTYSEIKMYYFIDANSNDMVDSGETVGQAKTLEDTVTVNMTDLADEETVGVQYVGQSYGTYKEWEFSLENGLENTIVNIIYGYRYMAHGTTDVEGKITGTIEENDFNGTFGADNLALQTEAITQTGNAYTVTKIRYPLKQLSNQTLTWSDGTADGAVKELNNPETSFNSPTVEGVQGGVSVTYTSSDETVATVNASTGSVTVLGGGQTTITAATARTDSYAASSISYVLDTGLKAPMSASVVDGVNGMEIQITMPSTMLGIYNIYPILNYTSGGVSASFDLYKTGGGALNGGNTIPYFPTKGINGVKLTEGTYTDLTVHYFEDENKNYQYDVGEKVSSTIEISNIDEFIFEEDTSSEVKAVVMTDTGKFDAGIYPIWEFDFGVDFADMYVLFDDYEFGDRLDVQGKFEIQDEGFGFEDFSDSQDLMVLITENSIVGKTYTQKTTSYKINATISGQTEEPEIKEPQISMPTTSGSQTTVKTEVEPEVTGETAKIQEDTQYIDKATQEAIAEASKQGTTPAVTVDLFVPEEVKYTTIPLSPNAAEELAKNEGQLMVRSNIAELRFDAKSLAKITEIPLDSLSLEVSNLTNKPNDLTQEQREIVGNNLVFDFTLRSYDETISDFGDGYVDVLIPVDFGDEDIEGVKVYFIADNGTLEEISANYYAEHKNVQFRTNHFSVYMVQPVSAQPTVAPTTAPTPTPPHETPHTGDDFNPMLWISVAVVSVTAILIFVKKKIR